MSQGKPIPRVSSGVPWWIWLTGIALSIAVILGIFSSRNTDDPDDLFALAIAASDARNGNAVEAIRQRLAEFPERQDLIDVLDGVVATGTNRDPRAIKLLLPHVDKGSPLAQRTAVKYCAMAYQRSGQAPEARKMYQRAVELDPNDVIPHLLLATMYDQAGAYEPALKEAQAVLEIDPENMEAQTMVGRIRMEMGEWDGATEAYAELLSTDGRRSSATPDSINRYLACLLKTQQAELALDFLNTNAALVTDAGVKVSVLISSGEVDRAKVAVDQLTSGQTTPEMLIPINAKAAMMEEDWSTAVGLLREQVRLSPRAAEAFQMLEEAARANHETELAQAARENLTAIEELEKEMYAAIRAIGSDLEDPQKRLAVAHVAAQLGQQEMANEWVVASAQVAADRVSELQKSIDSIRYNRTPLVPLPGELAGTIFDPAAGPTPFDLKDEQETEPTAETDENPGPDSESVQPEPSDNSPEDESTSPTSDDPAAPNGEPATSEDDTTPESESPENSSGEETAEDDVPASK